MNPKIKTAAAIGLLALVIALAGCVSKESTATDDLPGIEAPQSGNIINTGSPTPSPTQTGQEKISISAGGYKPKFYPDGSARQEIAFNNIPKTIPLIGGLVIKNLKIEGDYFNGYIKNAANQIIPLGSLSFNYLDGNGIRTRYASKIEIRAYNDATKEYRWIGAGNIPAGQEYYFRVNTMRSYDEKKEINFVQISY